ncbi:MAG: pseudaminic acid biosynthesis-associated methylase [Verrucomicrobia bacterium]|nr:pseudaminic acid biosynthesis-associated methylase [Verrucomicrobiota bacterium]
MSTPNFKTEQEAFWHGQFGNDYIARNKSEQLLAANLALFSRALAGIDRIKSCVEFGANVGMNLRALKLLFPECAQHAIEINASAVAELKATMPTINVLNASLLDVDPAVLIGQVDFALIKGVLIHINPDALPNVYQKLYDVSRRYIFICEYYNPTPVSIDYRGNKDRLFKRDFAGEMLDRFPDLKLVDYGFRYRRDKSFPADDTTWFLLEKRQGDPTP